ncbi:universal stress protein [Zunongwangia sp. F363]|uniref:Universal stress protein n=1 Tax=Autumnicola tepida TaxID=3075595 RepID=A0ABU3CBS4_9FLAO|nr:universal stress protein [Zunongwangia sp. F363]MDT0643790.1 universal stress protein [Zunongwangia sp. F363]
MKNILVATDFSRESYCALYYATELYRNEECTFSITNFYGNEIETSVYSIVNEEELEQLPKLKAASQTRCTEVVHRITRDNKQPAHTFETNISDQKLAHALPAFVVKKDIDLVVMGTRGHSGTLESLLGSNTSKVIEQAITCPLLVVPKELDFKAPRKIVFATELKKKFSHSSLAELKKLAVNFQSKITILYVGGRDSLGQKQKDNLNHLKMLLQGIKFGVEYLPSDEEVSKAVSAYVKENKIQLLSMVYYPHNFTHTIFREPVIRKIDQHLAFPFLVLPQKTEE